MHTPNPSQFKNDPAYLRALVERAQLAQAEMAERIGVDARTFRRYVTGESGFAYPVQFAVECVTRAIEAETLPANHFRSVPDRALMRILDQTAAEKMKLAPTSAAYRRTLKTLRRVEREVKRRSNGK
jgi:transcriptional regulator with XRE-family HTH domain